MEDLIPMETFKTVGSLLLGALLAVGGASGLWGAVNLLSPRPVAERLSLGILVAGVGVFLLGFFWFIWLHYQIYLHLPLVLPDEVAKWLNHYLSNLNQKSPYGLPLYNPSSPPRYILPLWIENEKYYFWFMSYAFMALYAHRRLSDHRFRGALLLGLAIQIGIMAIWANPFARPLPRFFEEISPWFNQNLAPMAQLGLFMKLYSKMVFYYNAEYMWFHPPLLFLSYAAISVVFICSLFMLFRRQMAIEAMSYSMAKLAFFLLTLGMLLGYPWALKAWGPNWWWDPKIAASIMMWVIFSAYLHIRLYIHRRWMWHFSAFLGILCFGAMVFTFLASFFFPGQHTMQ